MTMPAWINFLARTLGVALDSDGYVAAADQPTDGTKASAVLTCAHEAAADPASALVHDASGLAAETVRSTIAGYGDALPMATAGEFLVALERAAASVAEGYFPWELSAVAADEGKSEPQTSTDVTAAPATQAPEEQSPAAASATDAAAAPPDAPAA